MTTFPTPPGGTPAPAAASTPTATPAPPPAVNARRRVIAAAVLATVAGAAFAACWWTYARGFESTDDAYVAGNIVQVTPLVSGTVVSIGADDTQRVTRGDPLVRLDRADSEVALAQAAARLATTVRQVRMLFVNDGTLEADIAQREADVTKARDDLRRRLSLDGSGAVSSEDVAHARTALDAAESAWRAARERLAGNRALTDRTTVATHPDVARAIADYRAAYLAYARSTLPAPVTGVIARRAVQVGQRVAPGTPLMAVVPLDQVWVDANFKENQLARMRAGQPVTLRADLYGGAVRYHGHVVGFSAGTGAAFSVLPAQNATGNWIKVVQRLAVRIALDPAELRANPLRIGLSMRATVDVSEQGGARLAAIPAATSLQTDVYDAVGREADTRVAAIIADNMAARGGERAR